MPWPLIAGMAMQAIGSNQAAAATEEGAQAQADIEELNRDFQRKLFDEEMARLAPRQETALQRGLPMMEQYRTEGQIDQSQMPLYQMQMEQGQQAMADAGIGSYGANRFQEGLGAAENDASYARLQDMMQIGLGASELAGAGARRFGTSEAQSIMGSGNAMTSGAMGAGNIRNSMYSNLAGQAGQIPAYMSMNQQQRPTNLQGPQLPYGGVR